PFESGEEKVTDDKPEKPLVEAASDKPEADAKAQAEQAADKSKNERPSKSALVADKNKKSGTVKLDLDNISQRILSLPIPARNYGGLWTGKEGVLFLSE